MSALGRPQDMFSDTAIQLQPVFAQWIQNTHALAPGATAPGATASTSLTWGGGGGDLVAVGGKVALLPIPLGTADFFGTSHSCIYDSCDGIDTSERCSICS
ncbi:putative photosystem I [Helianthus annuus]|uniref:Photosystem I n=2 Tax=Helianthus annuus TaxID=4232 RepID=A0A9K3JVJ5_HELAN|nr:putative photosystem I [Helianthus annuus]KAJ0611402.1 putative photosystem I [Helianthus annuus]